MKTLDENSTLQAHKTPHEIIKRRAKERGITYGEIAIIAGTTRMAISQVVHGRSRSRRLRRVICNELQIHPYELGWTNIYVI